MVRCSAVVAHSSHMRNPFLEASGERHSQTLRVNPRRIARGAARACYAFSLASPSRARSTLAAVPPGRCDTLKPRTFPPPGSLLRRALSLDRRITMLRAEKRWSQAELADRVGVSRNSINAVENGKFDPSLPLAFRIADVFGLAIEQVF